jgi:hypothetical protein
MHTTKKEWLNKREASKVLEMSTRSVLLMAKTGQIQSKRQMDPESRQLVVMLHAGDVERVRYDRQHPEERAVQPAQGGQGSGTAQLATLPKKASDLIDLARIFAATFTAAHQAPSAPSVNQWLTLEQSAQESSLSRELLLRLIHQGKLPALKDDPIKGEGEKRAKAGSSWRVCRRDLDALQGEVLKSAEP